MHRILFGMNIIAFFFGFIYFFILGLWKMNLVLLGINIACAMMRSMTANDAYYLKEMKSSDSWNQFEGISLV